MRYSSGYLNVNGIANDFHAYGGNDIYDPDATGVGHQPTNYDTLKLIYAAWNVRSCRLKIRLTSNGTTFGSTNARVIVLPQDTSSALTTVGTLLQENPGVKIFYVNSQTAKGTVERNFYAPSSLIIREWSPKEPTCYGYNATSPPNGWWWGIYLEAIDDSSTLSMAMEVFLEYDVEWFQRIFSYTT